VADLIAPHPEMLLLLRRQLGRHHLQVIVVTLATLAGAMLLWGLAYFLFYWLALFGLSISKGGDAVPPAHFTAGFVTLALFTLVLAWIDRRFTPDERAVDRKPRFEIFLDFMLVPARTTLAIWGSMTAWLKLDENEMAHGAALLGRLQHERKLAEQSIPVDVPDDAVRARVVFALLLLGLAEQRREEGVTWLHPLQPVPQKPRERNDPALNGPGLFE
jgi:hypothetical protein